MSRSLWLLTGLLFVWSSRSNLADSPRPGVAAVKKTPTSNFLRITEDAKRQPLALETAIVRYRPAGNEGDVTVDLVSVVHLGERDYYRKLNRLFEDYDVVLYELVAPKGTRIPKGGRKATDNPLALLHKIATLVLDLDLQTAHIDYTRDNFLHADLSPADMAEAIRKRGDDSLTLFLSIAADILRQQNLAAEKPARQPANAEPVDVVSLLTDPAAPAKLKRLMAEQLAALESLDSALGRTINTILIRDRNEAAMKVFQKELAKGRKKIAIFYGAGHMPDFERRLRADFGLRPVSTRWLRAWDLRLRERGVEEILWKLLVP